MAETCPSHPQALLLTFFLCSLQKTVMMTGLWVPQRKLLNTWQLAQTQYVVDRCITHISRVYPNIRETHWSGAWRLPFCKNCPVQKCTARLSVVWLLFWLTISLIKGERKFFFFQFLKIFLSTVFYQVWWKRIQVLRLLGSYKESKRLSRCRKFWGI